MTKTHFSLPFLFIIHTFLKLFVDTFSKGTHFKLLQKDHEKELCKDMPQAQELVKEAKRHRRTKARAEWKKKQESPK